MTAPVARETGRPIQPRSVARETLDPTCAGHDHAVARETVAAPSRPGPLARALLAPLRAYRRWISPLLAPRCRYYPSCSSYAEQAIRELGPLRGLITACWRLMRCNPLSSGGLDPLESRRLFRSEGAGAEAEHREVHV